MIHPTTARIVTLFDFDFPFTFPVPTVTLFTLLLRSYDCCWFVTIAPLAYTIPYTVYPRYSSTFVVVIPEALIPLHFALNDSLLRYYVIVKVIYNLLLTTFRYSPVVHVGPYDLR